MIQLLSDRGEFRKAVLVVAFGFAIWSLASYDAWGWIPALVVVAVVALQLKTEWLPDSLFVLAVSAPTVVAESGDKGSIGYFVVIMALAYAATASPVSRVNIAASAAVVVSPLVLWAARVDDYVELGPWTWLAGLALGWMFGLVVGRLQRALDELEASQSLLAESSARDERQRIARELHDLVGHSFSVVLLHLGGARTTLASDPDAAAAALTEAEAVGRKGMDDLREALALMRDDEASRRPVARLDEIAALADEYRRAGLDVRVSTSGRLDRVRSAVGIVLYEVVRECLTNAAKHAPSGPVDIDVRIDGGDVDVRVRNPAVSDAPAPAAGSGIRGMRERVQSLGGSFSARCADGEWQVNARVPATTTVSKTEATQG